MNENYLWDKSGEPDPEIERLENLLAPLGDKTPVLSFPKRNRIPYLLAIAASLLVLAGGVWVAWQRSRPAWEVSGTLSAKRLSKGESINTDAHSRARLNLNDVGEVEIEPNTKLSVLADQTG